VSFWRGAKRFEDEALGGMKSGEVGCTASLVCETLAKERRSAIKQFSGLVELGARFGLHRSTPSLRTSPISGVRSLYEPTGYGMA